MDNPSSQIAERLQQATNILVTVSKNPSVDQLSSAIGLTLLLNKLGKHAVAVFSGSAPSTLKFLQPEKTFEKNTDSLRDFIIALDKSKADKLRYKVENQVVKIFITPYRTSISEQDLDFSQGDFNVEVVVALGVTDQKDLDQAIVSHGRILHDATVISINTTGTSNLGTLNWVEPKASSLAEMLASLTSQLKADALDGQMATAFLTGIVAETDRFSNDKTSSTTMQISSQLMAAGANQKLIATELESPASSPAKPVPSGNDGSLEIDHGSGSNTAELPEPDIEQIHINEEGEIDSTGDKAQEDSKPKSGRGLTLEPPSLGGKLSANIEPERLDPSTDPLGVSNQNGPILSHTTPKTAEEKPIDLSKANEAKSETLTELEAEVHSPHLSQTPIDQLPKSKDTTPKPPQMSEDQELNAARSAVEQAMQFTPLPAEPLQRTGAQPLDIGASIPTPPTPLPSVTPSALSTDLPPGLVPTTPPVDNTASSIDNPTAPPPVPPPLTLPEDTPSQQPPAGPPQTA